MSVFGTPGDLPEIELSDQHLSAVLSEIKRNSRNRRIAMIAPVALAAAVLATLVAAPPRYGGLALVPDASASNTELPRVFGSNGVWRLAEPIAEVPTSEAGPADVIEAPTNPAAPEFVLSPPTEEELQSLPTSTSTPPTSTSGQSPAPADADEADASSFAVEIRVEPEQITVALEPAPDETAATDAAPAETPTSPPETTTPTDVTVADDPQIEIPEPAADSAVEGDQLEVNPSTPLDDQTTVEAPPISDVASIIQPLVLVYDSAHVSVTVQVVDDDSSVIDWCNTRVDWGDGSVTGVVDINGGATCTAPCEYEATPFDVGIDETLQFTHEYTVTIDAAPRIFVATGDGCNYTLAELQLNPFTVVPY